MNHFPSKPAGARAFAFGLLLALVVGAIPGHAEDISALCADRTAIEHVYYEHRLGQKPAFEQASPAPLIARLVQEDRRKEAALKRVYGVEITAAMVAAEVQRINATTRAPEVLAEIKAALGHDPVRFANSFARPIVVERVLRARFENDDALHAPQRALAASTRDQLLASPNPARVSLLRKTKDGQFSETTWELAPRPTEAAPAAPVAPVTPTKVSAHSGAYAVEATVQQAQVLGSRALEGSAKFYFEDLDPELQKVLRAQLRQPGDVSAVIESSGGFVVFLTREKTAASLSVSSISIPKRSYDEWLAAQPVDTKS